MASTGYPVPGLSETSPLPAGITFTDNGDGTATLAGTPAIGQAGSYPLAVVAANGAGNNFTQAVALTVQAKGGSIFGLAGSPDGKPGVGGDSAGSPFNNPAAVAVDTAGNVYVADSYNNQVRKIDVDGNGSIIAGSPTGLAGNSGDGGAARAATLSTPYGLAVDSAGNVYIGDSGNNRVRRIDSNGKITNVAGHPDGSYGNDGDGGPATSAGLSEPTGLAADPAGNVYIADTAHNRVRRVDTAGTITNVAGDPSGVGEGDEGDGGPAVHAGLFSPSAVAVDTTGNLFIAEEGSSVVRKVDVRGTITTFAGDPFATAANSGDGGPATSAPLLEPGGVATDAAGNVYIADTLHSRIRIVDTGGTITNFAGNAAAIWGNSGDGGPASAAALNDPVGVAIGPSGIFYIADSGNNRVRLVPSGVGAPGITSPEAATFTVGIAGSFTVTTTGVPAPTVTIAGMLPSGLTFNTATATLSGTPAQGTVGAYGDSVLAINGAKPDGSQSLNVIVNQAMMTYPDDGQANVDTTVPFTWSTIPQAQGYYLIVGRNLYGAELVNSGVLPPTQSSFNIPALPAGATLHAALYAQVNGSWSSYQSITFTVTANPGQATFTFPATNQAGVDPTRPLAWLPIAHAQNYYLIVGTTLYGANLVNSGVIPATQSTYQARILPAGRRLYATLYTQVNGAWRFQSITFTASAAAATFTSPLNGQANVATPTAFTWSPVFQAQGYYLTVGITPYGSDLVASGVVSPSQSSLNVPALPKGKTLYATLFTALNGTWTGTQQITFSAG